MRAPRTQEEWTMASVKKDVTAKYQTTKDADIEETSFKPGDQVTIVQTWQRHYLVKDRDGHFYNLTKDVIEP